jgi:tol-pal system protein YbgF
VKKRQMILFLGAAMVAGAIGSMMFAPAPAGAIAKEMMQLLDEVGQIQQSQKDMTSSLDTKFAVLKTLIEQQGDSNAKLGQSIAAMQKVVQDLQANSGAQLNSMGTQVSGVSDNVTDVQTHLSKINQQLAEVQSTLQSLDAKVSALSQPAANPNPGAVNPGAPSGMPSSSTAMPAPSTASPNPAAGAASPSMTPPPSAEALYNSALQDWLTRKFDLAQQEFAQYLKYYPNTDYASNAVFYLGEIAYAQKRYAEALDHYSDVLANFPNSFKLADSLYKRGLTNLDLGKRPAAINDLREAVRRYPNTDAEKLARAKLHELNVPVTAAGR